METKGLCYVVVGAQYGDEGKGKVSAVLTLLKDIPYAVRCGVGPNAGHGVWYESGKMAGEIEGRHIPCGFVNPRTTLFIAPGTSIDPEVLETELGVLEGFGIEVRKRLKIDSRCPIVEERHRLAEKGGSYLHTAIGSMGSGCGNLNAERALRDANVRFAGDIESLRPYIVGDVSLLLVEKLNGGENLLVEGTQGFGLSLVHGPYPYVTSKDTTASQFLADAGIPPSFPVRVYTCLKPYTTRAGTGPLKGENDPSLAHITEREVRPGVVIGEERRIGLFDKDLVGRALVVNGATDIALTNVDRMWPEDYGKTTMDKLSLDATRFVDELEKEFNVPVTLISTGCQLEHVIFRE
ncbi:MAG: adenylosuccinate synthetase [Chloroflexota bacterium]|nr:adenylosuccinate synthetase [Chloroflexota bacterium]